MAYGDVNGARSQSCKPAEGGLHLNPHAKFWESKSTFKREYPAYAADAAKQKRGQKVADTLSPISAKGAGSALDNMTSYRSEFGTRSELQAATGSCKPSHQTHVRPDAKFLVSKTTFAREFPAYDAEAAHRSRGVLISSKKDTSSTIVAKAQDTPLDSMTSYRQNFGSVPDLHDARGPNFKPPPEIHVDMNSKLLVRQSAMHRAFPMYSEDAAKKFRGEPVKHEQDTSNLITAKDQDSPFGGSTSYQSDFSASRYRFRSSPTLRTSSQHCMESKARLIASVQKGKPQDMWERIQARLESKHC